MAEVEYVSHAEVQLVGVCVGRLKPAGTVQVDVLDEKRIEGVHVSHQQLVLLWEEGEGRMMACDGGGKIV